ncbi:MAG: hypothetical protein H6708_05190 [Kofleriaceae bacterium]|nr:hypothetical protein [Myxococcales bacterium]MCB9559783.1 hypothetical protein [Kofleriaceae bacterium]
MNLKLKHGALIAMAAGSLFASACKKDEAKSEQAPAKTQPADKADTAAKKDMPAAHDDKAMAGMGEQTAKVHCSGINECKGHGACKTANNACAGQNGCKGQSFVNVESEQDCKDKGGTVMASN